MARHQARIASLRRARHAAVSSTRKEFTMPTVHAALCYCAITGAVAFIGFVACHAVAHAIDTLVEVIYG